MFIASGSSEMYLKVSFKSKLNLSSSRGIKGAPERLGASGSNVASACRVQAKCLASKACLPAPLIRSPTDNAISLSENQKKKRLSLGHLLQWPVTALVVQRYLLDPTQARSKRHLARGTTTRGLSVCRNPRSSLDRSLVCEHTLWIFHEPWLSQHVR